MKFRNYVENANKLLKERPETRDMQVVSSIDEDSEDSNAVCIN